MNDLSARLREKLTVIIPNSGGDDALKAIASAKTIRRMMVERSEAATEIDTLTKRVEELERIDVIASEAVRQLAGWEARAKDAEARLTAELAEARRVIEPFEVAADGIAGEDIGDRLPIHCQVLIQTSEGTESLDDFLLTVSDFRALSAFFSRHKGERT